MPDPGLGARDTKQSKMGSCPPHFHGPSRETDEAMSTGKCWEGGMLRAVSAREECVYRSEWKGKGREGILADERRRGGGELPWA